MKLAAITVVQVESGEAGHGALCDNKVKFEGRRQRYHYETLSRWNSTRDAMIGLHFKCKEILHKRIMKSLPKKHIYRLGRRLICQESVYQFRLLVFFFFYFCWFLKGRFNKDFLKR